MTAPNILHYGEAGEGVTLEPGMLFTIEPMINLGRPHVKVLPDGWTAVTRDRELSAQFEHTRRRDRDRVRGVHASRPPGSTSPASIHTRASGVRHAGSRQERRRHGSKRTGLLSRSTGRPNTQGHRQRLRERFRKGGADALPDYELLELVLFRALPRRDTKGIAKRLLARFGTFAEVINAPEPRLKELQDVGDSVITELKLVRAAALRLMRTEIVQRPALSSWKQVLDYLRAAQSYEHREQFRILFLDKKQPPDRRRGAGSRYGRPYARLRAGGGQARAGAFGNGDHTRAQPPVRRPHALARRHRHDEADRR